MLLVSSMNIDPDRRGSFADGAVIAFVVGVIAVVAGGFDERLRALLAEPLIVGLGLISASVLGGALSGKVVGASRTRAVAISLVYGLAVPAIVALLIAFPVAPIALGFSMLAWPITIPAALAWLALLRLQAGRLRGRREARSALAVVLAAALLAVRFTQPLTTTSAAGAACITFPGERIVSLAWSPDGEWLGLGSERDYAEGVIRLVEQRTGRVVELARGPNVSVSSGIAVGPGGETTYIVDAQGASVAPQDEEWSAWTASPASAPRRLTYLPTPALFDLTWTPDGVAAVLAVDPTSWTEIHRLVWLRANTPPADSLEPIDPETATRYPVLSPLLTPDPKELNIQVGGKERRVPWPEDAAGDVSVTPNGAYIVFHARKLSADAERELYNHLVAQSTATGDRVVLAEEEAWEARLSTRSVAYLTFPANKGNSACVKDAPAG
jgi:hypothetical protein